MSQSIITLGIGGTPTSLTPFVTSGLFPSELVGVVFFGVAMLEGSFVYEMMLKGSFDYEQLLDGEYRYIETLKGKLT